MNLKLGIKLLLGDRFVIEPHIGIGIVYRKSKHYERENIKDQLLYDDFYSSNKLGNELIFNFPLNIKVGYRF